MEEPKKKVVVVRKTAKVEPKKGYSMGNAHNDSYKKPEYRKPYKKSYKKPFKGKKFDYNLNKEYDDKDKPNNFKEYLYSIYFDKVKKFDPVMEFKKIQKQFLNIGGTSFGLAFQDSNFMEYGFNYYMQQLVIFKNLVNFWHPYSIKRFLEKHANDDSIWYKPETDDEAIELYKKSNHIELPEEELSELKEKYFKDTKKVKIGEEYKELFKNLLPLVDDVKKDN